MCFGTLQASKANTNVTRKNSILCGQEMADHYIEEKLLTITVIGGENDWVIWSCCFIDYGHVITFDTTYMTNRYSMPLAIFVGFNNVLQNVGFAHALIKDERTNTFEWVLQQFKNCMDGKDLIKIFTSKENGLLLL
jgi:hypothetical protein